MDVQISGIITLLRSALKNEALVLPKDFEWCSACRILYEHHLTGLAVRGAMRCGFSATMPELRSLTAQMCKDISNSRLQTQQLELVYALFEENGIDYVPLKGAVLKDLYPQAELRLMGDVDILIRPEQYPVIRTLLPSVGMEEKGGSDHEYTWYGPGLELELHKCLISACNKDYFDYYGDGWGWTKKEKNGVAFRLTKEDHFIYLLVHFAKHYRNGSVKAKNICDFWVYRNAYPDMDEAYIRTQMEKLGIAEFYQNVLQLLDTWFNGSAPTKATELITESVFQGGVRRAVEAQTVYGILRQDQETISFAKQKRRCFLDRVFPSVKMLSVQYPVLMKYPVFLPLFWIIRGAKILLHRPKFVIRRIKCLWKMEEVQIESYKEDLHAVGLDAKFTR